MPRIPVPRRLWDGAARLLGRRLSDASTGLGRGLSDASTRLGQELSDAARLWHPTSGDAADAWSWKAPPGVTAPPSSEGMSLREAAGGGAGGFGGPSGAGRPGARVEIPLGRLLGPATVLAAIGLVLALGSGLGLPSLREEVGPVSEAVVAAPVPTPASSAGLNGPAADRIARARLGVAPTGREREGHSPFSDPGAPPPGTAGRGDACRARDGWYELPPTPTPTPLPRPLPCRPGLTLRTPPEVETFRWDPAYPTLATQGRPDPETGRVDFTVLARGGTVYRAETSGGVCRLTAQPDPLVRVELDWVLLPPSWAWIHRELSRRYVDAYSRARVQGIQCAVIWEGRARAVDVVYPDWTPLDPGLYGVRVHLYTAGGGYGVVATPVPVYLRDTTLWEEP